MCSFCFHFPSAPVKSPPTPAALSLAAEGEGGEEGADAANVSGRCRRRRGLRVPFVGSPSHEIIPGWCCWKLPNELSCPNNSHQLPGERNACELARHGTDALMGLLWLLTRRQQPLIFLNTYLPHRPGTAPGHLLLPGPGPGHEPAGHEGHVQQPRTAPVGAQVLPAQTVTEAQRGAAGPSRAWG